MTLLICTIVAILLTAVGVCIGVAIKKARTLDDYNINEKEVAAIKKYYNKKFLLSIASVGWVFILLFGSFTKVGANTVGIIYDEMNGGIQDRTLDEGFQFKTIFQHVTTISTANRTSKVETYGQTNDGQSALFELSIIYNIQKENAGKFYRKNKLKRYFKRTIKFYRQEIVAEFNKSIQCIRSIVNGFGNSTRRF